MAKKRTPLKVLKNKGTYRKDRHADREELELPPGVPEKPDYLPELASKEWDRVIPELIETGVLARIDGPAVALYCILHGQLEKYVNEPSMFPASKISQYRAAMSDLGLNPAARTKIPGSKEKDKKKNPYAAAPNKKRGRTG